MESVACQSNKSNSAVTITANKMDDNNKTIDVKSTGSEGYTSINVSYIVQYIIHRSDPRLLPANDEQESINMTLDLVNMLLSDIAV